MSKSANHGIRGPIFLLAAVFFLTALGLIVSLPNTPLEIQTAAAAKPTPTPNPNVTSTIFDRTTDDSAFVDLRSDDLNPDLTASSGAFGIYGTSTVNSVVDRLEGNNYSDWSLHLEDSPTRWISLSLNRLTGAGPTGDYTLHGRVISRCFDPTGATTNTASFPSITTSNPNCSMHVNFTISGTSYGLIMSPYYANTGRAIVSCNALSGGQCVNWSIVPNPTQDSVINPNPMVANLFSNDPHNGKQTLVGTYSLTYRMGLTRP